MTCEKAGDVVSESAVRRRVTVYECGEAGVSEEAAGEAGEEAGDSGWC